MKGFYYNLYMSQFKGTIDDAEFEYIKPVEVYDQPGQPKTPIMVKGGGVGGGSFSEMMRQRAMEVVEIFKEKQATSQETAKSFKELGMSEHFQMMIKFRLIPLGIITEKGDAYYLSGLDASKL